MLPLLLVILLLLTLFSDNYDVEWVEFDNGVKTSGLADEETWDVLLLEEIDCVGDRPAEPIVECPIEPTDVGCGYW